MEIPCAAYTELDIGRIVITSGKSTLSTSFPGQLFFAHFLTLYLCSKAVFMAGTKQRSLCLGEKS